MSSPELLLFPALQTMRIVGPFLVLEWSVEGVMGVEMDPPVRFDAGLSE